MIFRHGAKQLLIKKRNGAESRNFHLRLFLVIINSEGAFIVHMKYLNKRVIIITGHYGCGKTNLAVNLALYAAKNGERICLADFDIVNPYFRASDMTAVLKASGVEVIVPTYAGSNLDIPAMPPQMNSLFDDKSRRVILDVGGDDAGAAALGRYSATIINENSYDNFYVINARRILTQTPQSAVEILREIEAAGHLPVTGIINNTNLSHDTDAGIIRESAAFAAEVSRLCSLPLIFTAAKEDISGELADISDIFPVKIYVRTPWDNED